MEHCRDKCLRDQLRNTSDTAHLLREALGHLVTFFIHQPRNLTSSHLKNVLLCKAVFDQYRVRLNVQDHQELSLEEISCVIDSVQVLVAIRRDTNRRANAGNTPWKQNLITSAFLAGVRVLNLAHHSKAHECLRECQVNWEKSDGLDESIVHPVLGYVAGVDMTSRPQPEVVIDVDISDPLRVSLYLFV